MGCEVCGPTQSLDYHCNYCGKRLCSDHRLPEKHNCVGLDGASTLGPDFRGGSGDGGFFSWLFDSDGSEGERQSPRDATSGEPDPAAYSPNPGETSGSSDDSEAERQPAGYDASKEPDDTTIEYQSSPDVAPDGSIVREEQGGETIDDRQSSGGSATNLVLGVFLLPFILIYRLVEALIGLVRSLLADPVALVVLIIAAVGAANLLGFIDLPLDPIISFVGGSLSALGNGTGEERTPSASSGSSAGFGEINRSLTERYVHQEVNAERALNGFSNVSWDPGLQEIARYHSQQMANDDFFSHTAPDGETMQDRYDSHGYECRVPTTSGRYLTGAENIHQTYHHENVIGEGKLTSEREVAESVVKGWMDSPGHRENILTGAWNNEGIGIHLTDGNGVYTTQNFC